MSLLSCSGCKADNEIVMQTTVDIPLEAETSQEDPRQDQGLDGLAQPGKMALALPSFALLPTKAAQPEDSDPFSWANAPLADLYDDAESAGWPRWLVTPLQQQTLSLKAVPMHRRGL